MTTWQWKVVKALCILVLALLKGETFDSLESSVQYGEEIHLLNEAIKR